MLTTAPRMAMPRSVSSGFARRTAYTPAVSSRRLSSRPAGKIWALHNTPQATGPAFLVQHGLARQRLREPHKWARRNMSSMHRDKHVRRRHVFVALGSNMGDRTAMIEQACKEMESSGNIRIVRTSSLWESKAMYVLDQDNFVNGACEVCSASVRPWHCVDPGR